LPAISRSKLRQVVELEALLRVVERIDFFGLRCIARSANDAGTSGGVDSATIFSTTL
jgi:hypothetical protein